MVGEHIRTRRDGRWSHAIDCGDETVLHLAEGPGTARVLRSYRPAFVSGAEVVEVVTHRERTYPGNEIVARAYSRMADPGLAAMFRDSEAFAEWCATGRLPSGAASVASAAPPPEPAPAPAPAPAPMETAARPASATPASARSKKAGAKRRAIPKRAARKAGPPRKKGPGRGTNKGRSRG